MSQTLAQKKGVGTGYGTVKKETSKGAPVELNSMS